MTIGSNWIPFEIIVVVILIIILCISFRVNNANNVLFPLKIHPIDAYAILIIE